MLTKKEIWTRVHRVLRGLPILFAMLRSGSINNDQFLTGFKSYKEELDFLLSEAQLIGNYYKHYIDLIYSMFIMQYIVFCERNDNALPSEILEGYTKEKEDSFFYHMQWNLLDLTEAELNREDVPNAPN